MSGADGGIRSPRVMPVEAVTDATFEQEVLRSELPVLIDFVADWCEPCKQLSPIVEEVAREHEGKLKVVHRTSIEDGMYENDTDYLKMSF